MKVLKILIVFPLILSLYACAVTYHSAEGTNEGGIKFFRDIYKKESALKKEIKSIVQENQNKKNQ